MQWMPTQTNITGQDTTRLVATPIFQVGSAALAVAVPSTPFFQ
jgi:hypothetical protein